LPWSARLSDASAFLDLSAIPRRASSSADAVWSLIAGTLACVYLDADKDGTHEHLSNRDLVTLARTTTFCHTCRRWFERLRE
jgi:hypothetical protein